jgi:hypothetical protein
MKQAARSSKMSVNFHQAKFRKIELLVVTVVRTSNPTTVTPDDKGLP